MTAPGFADLRAAVRVLAELTVVVGLAQAALAAVLLAAVLLFGEAAADGEVDAAAGFAEPPRASAAPDPLAATAAPATRPPATTAMPVARAIVRVLRFRFIGCSLRLHAS
ncbi:hypothetical protein GCM10027515_08910 [Schumannella luteola]